MADKPKKLSDTARALLTVAAMRGDHLIRPPKLPIAAARQVVRSLLGAGLAEETPVRVDDAGYAWCTSEDGEVLMLRATALGLALVGEGKTGTPTPEPIAAEAWQTTGADAGIAVAGLPPLVTDLAAHDSQQVQDCLEGASGGEDPLKAVQGHGDTAQAAVEPPGAVPARGLRHSLQQAAQAFLDAWDARAANDDDIADKLTGHVAALRSALAASASVAAAIDRTRPQKDTKQVQVLAMLRRNEGASGPQIAETMGWASHTVRGFLAGLAKKGIQVDVLERVRQVGANKQGAKGSYTVYRLAGAAGA
jgi:biotin operon repressor